MFKEERGEGWYRGDWRSDGCSSDHIKGREGGALARWTVFALASTAIVVSVAAIVVSVAAIDERKLRDLGALALLLRLLVGVGLAGALTLAVDLGAQA